MNARGWMLVAVGVGGLGVGACGDSEVTDGTGAMTSTSAETAGGGGSAGSSGGSGGAGPSCGNGTCDDGEDAASCPQDGCTCGDETCQGNEDSYNCAADCGTCGDGACAGHETPAWCPSDCGGGWCGDGWCGLDESESTCSADCRCDADGTCDADESQFGCPTDCGVRALVAEKLSSHAASIDGWYALLQDGTVRTWGFSSGENLLSDMSDLQGLAASTGLCWLKADGTVWWWNPYTAAPDTVPEVTDAVAVTEGPDGFCALLVDGTVACWTEAGEATWPGIFDATELSGAMDHTCARRTDSTLWCWGGNADGQLGDGETTDSANAVQVQGLSGVVAFAAAFGWFEGLQFEQVIKSSTCAVRDDGTVWCWGEPYGLAPAQVDGITGAVDISAGLWGYCALLANDVIRCWEDPGYVRGWPDDGFTPTGITAMVGDHDLLCVGLTDGTAWCSNCDGAGSCNAVAVPPW